MHRLSVIIESKDFPDEVVKLVSGAGGEDTMTINTCYNGEHPVGGSYYTKVCVDWYEDLLGEQRYKTLHKEIPKLLTAWKKQSVAKYISFSAVLARTVEDTKCRTLHDMSTFEIVKEVSTRNPGVPHGWESVAK